MSDALPSTNAPAPDAPAQRTIVRRAESVPLPRRLVAAALLFGVMAIVLNALPRPYKPLTHYWWPTLGIVPELGRSYGDTRTDIAAVDGQEEIAGQAPAIVRKGYRRELWMHQYLGIVREELLFVSVLLSGVSLFGAVALIGARARAERRALAAKGARLAPQILHTEVISPTEPSPVIAPPPQKPLLPDEARAPIVVDARSAARETPKTAPTSAPPAPTPAAEAPGRTPPLDPALAKLGFQPMAKPSPEVDEDGRPLTKNLARASTEPTSTTTAVSAGTAAASPAAAPTPATVADLAFPIGFPGSGPTRPIVRPGASTASEDPEHTALSADANEKTVTNPDAEKTVTNPDAEKTVESPENTRTDEKPSGGDKPD